MPLETFPPTRQAALKRVSTVRPSDYVRFDLNDYSVPHDHVRRILTVVADTQRVRILNGASVVATHVRSYDKGQQIEERAHIEALVAQKAAARSQRGMNYLNQAAPASRELLAQAAQRGERLGRITSSLVRMLDRYGAAELQTATLGAIRSRT